MELNLRWGRPWPKRCPEVPPAPVHSTVSFSKGFNFPLQNTKTGVEMFFRTGPASRPSFRRM